MGNHVLGCDICQDVCPWNQQTPFYRRARPASHARNTCIRSSKNWPRLTPEGFRQRFRGTALERPKRRGLLRNVCVAMGNSGNRAFIPLLEDLLQDDEPLIREHAAWALDQLRDGPAADPTRPSRT